MNENVEIEQKQQATHKKGEKQLPNLFIFLSTNWDDRFLSTEFMSKATNRIYIIYICVYRQCYVCELRLATCEANKTPSRTIETKSKSFRQTTKTTRKRREKNVQKRINFVFLFIYISTIFCLPTSIVPFKLSESS